MSPRKQPLTVEVLKREAGLFAEAQATHEEASLYGVSDGKAIGTYLEHEFRDHLRQKYEFEAGSSASGIDFPKLRVDLKCTSVRQPQSSCPFRAARQKVYGLGYSVLVFVYDKLDNPDTTTAVLNILHTIFVDESRTADYQTTSRILALLENKGNRDDLLALFEERNLPIDDIQAYALADEILGNPPALGYLTMSNALQWRLQYSRVIEVAGTVDGVIRIK